MNDLFKILLTFCLLAVISLWGGAQENLVPNPSFEDTVNCPVSLADISNTVFWTAPTQGSPDYFHTCNNGDVNVPNNIVGNQSALSGNAYVGITVYDTWNTWSYREYIQVQLQQALVSGQQYWLNFYVSLADSSIYAIQEIGAYFSLNQINDNSMDTTLALTPQVEFVDSVITDKNGWTKISGSFTATGNENYLIIGNFNRSQSTTAMLTTSGDQNFSYYYIDNICVSTDSSFCANYIYTGVEEPQLDEGISIYPNPSTDFFTIQNDFDTPFDIAIYNALGQKLHEEKNITDSNKTINTIPFSKGILFVKIKSSNQIFNFKLLKQ